ncbi:glutathione S-transferase family protein [Marimonas lutisalis]|uniref:glutathione S-transferase family protein n=1 Tax=Marimonas lutisalis TaxID=2545756 RepID=UPI0019615675|nr:glutathione S-transferase family protein [Marimonas lutisalis]
MMLRVYGRNNSVNVQLVMWTVHELDIPHERLDFGAGHASTRSEAFLAMNPMGLVPAIEDGPVALFESAAILRYLAAKYGEGTFWPADPVLRGPLDSWAEWGKNSFAAQVLELFKYDVRQSPATRDPADLDRITAALTPLAEILDTRLQGRKWVGGDDFTFADIACGHPLHRFFTMTWPRPALPALEAYYERLQERPAYRDHAMVSYEALRAK